MKYKSHILLLLVIGSFYTSCKKYPEDNSISLHTVKHRLTRSSWKVMEVLYNGDNINVTYNNSLILGKIEEVQIKFIYNNVQEPSTVRFSYNGNEDYFFCGGEWSFFEKKKYLSINDFAGSGSVDSVSLHDTNILDNLFAKYWTIIKLYKTDLKLKNKKGYEIIFKAVK